MTLPNSAWMRPPKRSITAGAGAFVRHVCELDAGRRVDQLDAQMAHRPGTGRAEVDFARLGLRKIDQLVDAFRRHGRMHDQELRHVGREPHGCEILDGVVFELVSEGGVGGQSGGGAEQQRVAVRGGFGSKRMCDRGAGAGAVIGDHRHAELVREPGAERARERIGGTAGRKRHDQADRLGRVSDLRCVSSCGCSEERETCGNDSQHGMRQHGHVSSTTNLRRLFVRPPMRVYYACIRYYSPDVAALHGRLLCRHDLFARGPAFCFRVLKVV